jgi:uncharacterized protein YndB with AHSA1/START domain
MQSQSFTTSFLVDQSPDEVFAAINDVRGWWTRGEIEGRTDTIGEVFTYRYQDIHRSTQRITELVPGTRVVWQVIDGYLSFAEDAEEWTGTTIIFDIASDAGKTQVTFTHLGLNPALECFESCSSGWGFYINGSLQELITTGRGAPGTNDA